MDNKLPLEIIFGSLIGTPITNLIVIKSQHDTKSIVFDEGSCIDPYRGKKLTKPQVMELIKFLMASIGLPHFEHIEIYLRINNVL